MKRRIKRAIKTLRSRLAQRREKVSARHLGDQARARGDWTRAGDLYRKHVEAEPQDFDIWVQLGHALKETGRYEEAEAAYVAGSRLRPRDADLWLMRGHLARMRGEQAAAARHYAVSASIDGNPQAIAERDRSLALAAGPLARRQNAMAPEPMRQVGAVQTIFDGHLRGWALDPDNPHQSPIVDILLDGELFESITADGPIRREAPGGRAFDLDVSGRVDLAHAKRLEVRLNRTGEMLEGGSLFAQIDGAVATWLTRFDNLAPGEHGRIRARAISQTAGASLDVLAYDVGDAYALQVLLHRMGEQISPSWRLVVADSGHDLEFTQRLADAADNDDRVFGVETADADAAAERFQTLLASSRAEWVLPLAAGVLPEPEMVFRLLDAADADIDMVLSDVVFYGVNPNSIEGFSAEPAWSRQSIDAEVRGRRLAALRRDCVRDIAVAADAPFPLTHIVRALGETALGVAHIPALLARSPVQHRAAPAPFAAPIDDGRSLVVVIEAPEALGVLSEQLNALTTEIGPDGRILLIDPYPRGETARAQLKRLSDRIERTPCRPESAGHALDMAIKAAVARQATAASGVVLIAPSIIPEAGAVRRLAARQAESGAAVVAGTVLDDEGRCQGLGFLIGPGGGLAPAWVHHLPHETGVNAWRPHPRSAAAFDLAALSGAAFETVGGFDPELSGVWRDIDFCLRIGRAGLGVMVEPDAGAVRSGPPAPASGALDGAVRRRWSSRLAQDDPFYSPLYSTALNYQPGALANPWLPVRISRRTREISDMRDAQPRLTPPPQEVAA